MSEKGKEKESNIKSAKAAPPKNLFVEYFESLVVTLVMALFGMTFIIQAVTVPTGSMQNTILVGDYLLVNKFIFSSGGNPLPFLPQREIRRGDIVVFKYPGFDDPQEDVRRGLVPYQINYVKRVIALPCEKVEFRNNQVFINDKLLPEHRVIGDAPDNQSALSEKETAPQKPDEKYSVYYSESSMAPVLAGQSITRPDINFAVEGKPMMVPEGNYFVMGDSRDNSEDSRFWGFVPRELIIGQAMIVYWSCDRGASGGSMGGCITNPRLDRIGKMIK